MLLGIDTGGTYTDAVLYDETRGVLAKAKALTSKHDLTEGVGAALAKVLPEDPGQVQLVSLSTTLATNALVEGQGGAAGLILIGYPEKALERAGLKQALGTDPAVFVVGGHTPEGNPKAPLDLKALRAAAAAMAPRVSAFAVAGFFAIRNPSHELAARELLRTEFGLPVTCAHELSAGLDAPRRALTALLNARLIPLIQQLVLAVRALMAEHGLAVPLMVVKGDGSLVSGDLALQAPVETILSGPAASLAGARALLGAQDMLVSDMGGTTTDIAVLHKGRPLLSASGASVGGYRTMVEAIAVHTVGLGGDSEVCASGPGRFSLGPRRAVPLSLLAKQRPAVEGWLAEQLQAPFEHAEDGRFLLPLRSLPAGLQLKPAEAAVWQALQAGPLPLSALAKDYLGKCAIERMLERGWIVLSAFTPSDAAHVLGLHAAWEATAAEKGAALLARQLGLKSAHRMAEAVFDEVVSAGAEALVFAAFGEEGLDGRSANGLGRTLLDCALGRQAPLSLLTPRLTLERPLAGMGAPAATYYPAIAERLNTELLASEHAEICNAVGAAASGIVQRVSLTITQLADGRYRVHLPDGVGDFLTLEAAAARASAAAEAAARDLADRAGAGESLLEVERADCIVPDSSGQTTFVESVITATAVGRPRLAQPRLAPPRLAQSHLTRPAQ
ncbi:MAG: hydantoinase/oxoprolinase family protein [Rhodospirillales bacterium]|nr:hydantoinase/oxoprolinase family protein [Rhodospirillales bacterium]